MADVNIRNLTSRRKGTNYKPFQWRWGVKWQADDAALSTGDGKCKCTIPPEADGMNLISAFVAIYTVSSSGNIQFQIRNETDSNDMLSTKIQIDANEKNSSTAGTAYVVDTTKDDVAAGDIIALDCDAAGTGAKGGEWYMVFERPES